MEEYKKLAELDSGFNHITEKFGYATPVVRQPGLETLCKIILEQQVSLQSAKAAFEKLEAKIVSFSPDSILCCNENDFKECGVSRQKAGYITGVAQAVASGSLNFDDLHLKPHNEIRNELIKLKGVGNWTVDIYLMFSLKSPDILPLGDIAIISAIKDVWGFSAINEIENHTKKWAPYRSYAAFLLWHYYLSKRGRSFPH